MGKGAINTEAEVEEDTPEISCRKRINGLPEPVVSGPGDSFRIRAIRGYVRSRRIAMYLE